MKTMKEIKIKAIEEALEKAGGNKTQAAKLLGISLRGFRNLWRETPQVKLPIAPEGNQDELKGD